MCGTRCPPITKSEETTKSLRCLRPLGKNTFMVAYHADSGNLLVQRARGSQHVAMFDFRLSRSFAPGVHLLNVRRPTLNATNGLARRHFDRKEGADGHGSRGRSQHDVNGERPGGRRAEQVHRAEENDEVGHID